MTSRWNSYLGQWSLSCFRGKDQGPTTGSTLFHCKKWRDSSFSALSLITASLPHRPSHCHKVGILFRTILATIDLSPLWRLVFVCAWQSAVPGSGWPNWGGSGVVLHLPLLLLLLLLLLHRPLAGFSIQLGAVSKMEDSQDGQKHQIWNWKIAIEEHFNMSSCQLILTILMKFPPLPKSYAMILLEVHRTMFWSN